jgi:ElaB/YqjD/DUF883 family membrane-anchored ribosome-binding protein
MISEKNNRVLRMMPRIIYGAILSGFILFPPAINALPSSTDIGDKVYEASGAKKLLSDVEKLLDKAINDGDVLAQKILTQFRDTLLQVLAQGSVLVDHETNKLRSDIEKLLARSGKAASSLLEETNAAALKTIEDTELNLYNVLQNLPMRGKIPRVIRTEPGVINIKGDLEFIRIVGNFLNQYNLVTVNGEPARIISTAPFDIELPSGIKKKIEEKNPTKRDHKLSIKIQNINNLCIRAPGIPIPAWIIQKCPDFTTSLTFRQPPSYKVAAEITLYEQKAAGGPATFNFVDGGRYKQASRQICADNPEGRYFNVKQCMPGYQIKEIAPITPVYESGASWVRIFIDPTNSSCAIAEMFVKGATGCADEGRLGGVGWNYSGNAMPMIGPADTGTFKKEVDVPIGSSRNIPFTYPIASVPYLPSWSIKITINEYFNGSHVRECNVLTNEVEIDTQCGHSFKHHGNGKLTVLLADPESTASTRDRF